MTDFEYDVAQKKRIARGAYNRKCGSKSRKCSLPSDHLTQGEWKKRNGVVMQYNLNQPMDWKTFQSAPPDLQREYLTGIMDRYHVHGNVLADMFGIAYSTLRRYTERELPGIVFPRGRHMTAAERARFAEFLGGMSEEALLDPVQEAEPQHEPEPEPEPEPVPDAAPDYDLQRMTMEFQTIIDPVSLYNTIRAVIPRQMNGTIASMKLEISFT